VRDRSPCTPALPARRTINTTVAVEKDTLAMPASNAQLLLHTAHHRHRRWHTLHTPRHTTWQGARRTRLDPRSPCAQGKRAAHQTQPGTGTGRRARTACVQEPEHSTRFTHSTSAAWQVASVIYPQMCRDGPQPNRAREAGAQVALRQACVGTGKERQRRKMPSLA
jgi:hypothetical protein